MTKLLTDDQVVTEVSKWQTRLKLDHWDIRVKIKSYDDIGSKVGQVRSNYMYLDANMSLTVKDEEGTPHTKQYMAEIIIHELLHVVLSGVSLNALINSPEEVAEEHAVCILTKAIGEAYDWK